MTTDLQRPSDAVVGAVQRRTLAVVITAQVFGGAGLAAGVTVGGLIAQNMLGNTGAAGLPSGVFTLGSAITAFAVGRLTQTSGRRPGLAAGFLAGAIGAAGIVTATVLNSPVLFFACLLVYGAGTATNLQTRYAGTDLAAPANRARAASVALVATTAGAVAGPNLVNPLGSLAESLGIPRLAGPFLLAAVAYGAASAFLFAFLRPDPLVVARMLNRQAEVDVNARGADAEPTPAPKLPSGVVLGASVMVITQTTMTAIMTMTPIQMRDHHHGLDAVGLVISLHIAAMYLPSAVTGHLVDKIGRVHMAVAAAVTLVASGIVAAIAPPMSLPLMIVALVLLGLGWNLGLISGTALIVDSTPLPTRARTQGAVDVLVALAGASGGALSGLLVDASGFATLALSGSLFGAALIPVAAWYSIPRRASSIG